MTIEIVDNKTQKVLFYSNDEKLLNLQSNDIIVKKENLYKIISKIYRTDIKEYSIIVEELK